MSDTNQLVRWALQQPCRFRQDPGWQRPETAAKQLYDLQRCSRALTSERLFEGVSIVSHCSTFPFKNSHGKTDYERAVRIPSLGFLVDDQLAPLGGVDAVRATCGGCPANAAAAPGTELAGCHGCLIYRPDSEQLEALLRAALDRPSLRAAFSDRFLETTPLWYGLWIETPLRREQAAVLSVLLQSAFSNDQQDLPDDMAHFLRALEIARTTGTPLHVELAPPGHYDLGVETTWAHCPRCKASSALSQSIEDDGRLAVCGVCGQAFTPETTFAEENDDDWDLNWDLDEEALPKLLGDAGYHAMVLRYIESQGYPPTQAAEIWDRELAEREKSAQIAAQNRERAARRPPAD